jgi:hypothetical protein
VALRAAFDLASEIGLAHEVAEAAALLGRGE